MHIYYIYIYICTYIYIYIFMAQGSGLFALVHFPAALANSVPTLAKTFLRNFTIKSAMAMFCSGCGEKEDKCKCRTRSRDRSEERDNNAELLSQIRGIVKEENQVVTDAMNKRIDAAEKRLDGHEVRIGDCQQGIEDLRKEFKQFRAAPVAGRTGSMLEAMAKQAWFDGFPLMEKSALEKKAQDSLGTPDGLFTKSRVPWPCRDRCCCRVRHSREYEHLVIDDTCCEVA